MPVFVLGCIILQKSPLFTIDRKQSLVSPSLYLLCSNGFGTINMSTQYPCWPNNGLREVKRHTNL